MFTLPLSDPLWRKLDDAYRDRDIPEYVQSLSASWDAEDVDHLFWGHLCHQDTCYGATYAVIPHLLAIARVTPDPKVRQDIAGFLAHVSNVAVDPELGGGPAQLQGLPDTLEGWEEKLDVYRDLEKYERKTIADKSLPQDVRDYAKQQLANVIDVLARPAVDADDLININKIRESFFAFQSEIAELCANVAQNGDPDQKLHALEGVAASLGDHKLAVLFSQGRDGQFRCEHCQSGYSFLVFGDRMAFYTMPDANADGLRIFTGEEFSTMDYRDGAPNRATGFVQPYRAGKRTPAAHRIADMLATQADEENAALLGLFTGTFECAKCGKTSGL